MSTSTVTVRIDDDVKMVAQSVLDEIGLSLTAAMNVFLKAVVRTRSIPFSLEAEPDPFYSESNLADLRRGMEEFEQGRVIRKTMDELRAME